MWSAWSPCSASCLGGTQSRTRSCTLADCSTNITLCNGAALGDEDSESQSCNEGCCPEDATWDTWSSWSDCSVTCGQGTETRQRTCGTPVCGGATLCDGAASGETDTDSRTCDTEVCCPVDGAWTAWSTPSSCSVTCGSGVRTRTRQCSNATCGGAQ
ncbi:uncharacterized protein MONBRDRAFT_16091, partial [Monosiga brevicollis MX1]